MGSEDVQSALEFQRQLISLSEKGQFQLRKWTSNGPELLERIPSEHKESFISVHLTNFFLIFYAQRGHPSKMYSLLPYN